MGCSRTPNGGGRTPNGVPGEPREAIGAGDISPLRPARNARSRTLNGAASNPKPADVDVPSPKLLGFARLGKRKRALLGSNPPRNTQAFADAMGHGVRANTMFDPGLMTVTHEVPLEGWGLRLPGVPPLRDQTPRSLSPSGEYRRGDVMPQKIPGDWGQSPHASGGGSGPKAVAVLGDRSEAEPESTRPAKRGTPKSEMPPANSDLPRNIATRPR